MNRYSHALLVIVMQFTLRQNDKRNKLENYHFFKIYNRLSFPQPITGFSGYRLTFPVSKSLDKGEGRW